MRIVLSTLNPCTNRDDRFKALLVLRVEGACAERIFQVKRYTNTTEVKALHKEKDDAFITEEAQRKSNAKEEEERCTILFPS